MHGTLDDHKTAIALRLCWQDSRWLERWEQKLSGEREKKKNSITSGSKPEKGVGPASGLLQISMKFVRLFFHKYYTCLNGAQSQNCSNAPLTPLLFFTSFPVLMSMEFYPALYFHTRWQNPDLKYSHRLMWKSSGLNILSKSIIEMLILWKYLDRWVTRKIGWFVRYVKIRKCLFSLNGN